MVGEKLRQPRFWRRIRHASRTSWAEVSTILQVPLGIFFFIATISVTLWLAQKGPAESQAGQEAGRTVTSSRGDTPARASTSGSPVKGDCVTEAGDRVACDAAHWGQLLSTAAAPCNLSIALGFLGGIPGTDTVIPRVKVRAIKVGCAVTVDGAPQVASVKGVLRKSSGDALRYCRTVDGQTVGCAQPHAEEVVKTANSPEELDCDSAATEYMGISPTNHADAIEVRKDLLDGKRRCLVAARGDNDFGASLRRLMTDALPLVAR